MFQPRKGTDVGPQLLKAYLEYAERGMDALGTERIAHDENGFDSPFEAEVAGELERRGFGVRSQIGCGGYRIDLAIVHPDHPGEFALGIECDGAMYHSSKTARDRDRLRQAVLENNLGWTIIRIWSTDWIRNRDRQVQRVITAFNHAINNGRHDGELPAQSPESPLELEPQVVARQESDGMGSKHYSDIKDVPSTTILNLLKADLRRLGATQESDLIRSVARQLGFRRSGIRIQDRITSVINDALKMGQCDYREDGRLILVRPAD